jgi:hypothetical protein
MSKPIFVQIAIQGGMDELWSYTQTPHLHQRWDLRFTDITYLPRPDPQLPQRFRYTTRLGFGLRINGEGETVGEQSGRDGQRTSALKFWSDDPKSLIHIGTGYWKYTPTPNGLSFETGYDYSVRFGAIGQLFDSLIFRPLIGWATAWSFDRLRLWIEKGIQPEISLQNSLIHALARLTVTFVWIYHGLIPKLLFQHPDELRMLQDASVPASAISIIGLLEIGLGLFTLFTWRARWVFVLTIALMTATLIGVTINSPAYLVAAFNPVTLNVLMIAVSLIGYLAGQNLPSASHCRRSRGKNE